MIWTSILSCVQLSLLAYLNFLRHYAAGKTTAVVQPVFSLLPHTRTSHPLSKALRPWVQKRRFQTMVGTHLAAAIISVKLLGDIGGPISLEPVETTVLSQETVQVLTESRFRFPLEKSNGYSQGYHRFHPGVDIRAPLGTPIYPLAAGKVTEVELGRWAYGHKVVVEHQTELQPNAQLTTFYAHLGQVNVKTNDQVTKDTVLGEVGLTGWTTGPHLHLEVTTDTGHLNPKQILPNPDFSP